MIGQEFSPYVGLIEKDAKPPDLGPPHHRDKPRWGSTATVPSVIVPALRISSSR